MGLTRLYTVADVADAMGKGIETILNLIHSGDLKASNVSRSANRPSWRIHPDDYDAFVEARSNQQQSKAKPTAKRQKPKREYV